MVTAIVVHPRIRVRPLPSGSLTRLVTLAVRPAGYLPPACEPMLAAIRNAASTLHAELTAGKSRQRLFGEENGEPFHPDLGAARQIG
jgi:hypothetical protein